MANGVRGQPGNPAHRLVTRSRVVSAGVERGPAIVHGRVLTGARAPAKVSKLRTARSMAIGQNGPLGQVVRSPAAAPVNAPASAPVLIRSLVLGVNPALGRTNRTSYVLTMPADLNTNFRPSRDTGRAGQSGRRAALDAEGDIRYELAAAATLGLRRRPEAVQPGTVAASATTETGSSAIWDSATRSGS